MTGVFILYILMLFLIYRDKMRAEGLNHYPNKLGIALNKYKVNTRLIIYIRSQSGHLKIKFVLSYLDIRIAGLYIINNDWGIDFILI